MVGKTGKKREVHGVLAGVYATARSVREAGGEALFECADVSRPAEVEGLIHQTVRVFGRLDCAFNNVGTMAAIAQTADYSEKDWDSVLSVNLKSVWLCMKHEIAQMLKQGGGVIVNNSSIAGFAGFRGLPAYVVSKHGVPGLTKSAAMEYAEAGIRVNAICPGPIQTPMAEGFLNDPDLKAQVIASVPIGRMGRPEERCGLLPHRSGRLPGRRRYGRSDGPVRNSHHRGRAPGTGLPAFAILYPRLGGWSFSARKSNMMDQMPPKNPTSLASVAEATLEIRNPYSGEVVGVVHEAGLAELDRAIAGAERAFQETRRLPAHRRRAILGHMRARLEADRERIARLISAEAGKPIRDARTEVGRALLTLTIAAEEAGRIEGDVLPLDLAEHGEGRLGIVRRFPIGPVGAITPFNFPLNLVLHKVGPALAAGNTLVLKPSPRTPLTALAVAELAAGSGLPEGALSVLPAGAEVAQAMAADPHLKMLTFTGSAAVGWALKAKAGKKRVTLELGGNSGTVIHSDADLEYAATRVTLGGFSFAGQSCVSVQRVFVERSVYDRFLELLLPKVRALKLGDPQEESTDVGPMIDQAAAERAEAWVGEALSQGARLLAGGKRRGLLFEPTVLADTRPEMRVNCLEVFAPLITVTPYDDFDATLEQVNASPFGLHAGVFTRDNARIFRAFEKLEVGGVIVNDIPSYRVDHMPYGGSKDSGFGREGLRYAIEEMTEVKIMVLNLR